MKKGFTMIELIFVIVIIGILAAVAVPKLGGIKDDAEATKAVANLSTFKGELLQYYAKTSELPDLTKVKIEDITNVTGLKINGNAIDVKVGKDEDCFKITFSTTDSSMTITPGANKGTVCKTAIAAAKAARLINDDGSAKTEKLGGGSIYDTTDIK